MTNEYAATIGSVISVDGWNHAEALNGCEWDAAAFRLPSRATGTGIAVNVEVLMIPTPILRFPSGTLPPP